MKTSILFTLLSGLTVALLLPGCGKSQPQAAQTPPTAAIQTNAAPAVQAEPANATATPTASAGPLTQFTARSGSKMRIDGTANMLHPQWRVQGEIIQGKLDVGAGFPTEPGQAATLGPIVATVDVFIPVTSLKSIESDGSHYSDAMDNIMYEKLKPEVQKKIYYHLTELVLKAAAQAKDQPYVFEAKGELAVAGVTNKITMPVQVLPLSDKKLKISGTVTMKMTDFKMTPPTALGGALKTGDVVTNSFDWLVGPKAATAAAK
jgi:hypothetical protein